MQTASRRAMDLAHPDPDTICLPDIAHALSRLCRYNGMTSQHYSVAEHCCHVADYLLQAHGDPELALAGLMHDASEAYVGDLTYPMQLALGPEGRAAVKAMHARVWNAIQTKLDLQFLDIGDGRVLEADQRILLDECDALLGGPVKPWDVKSEPLGVRIQGWDAATARREWVSRWAPLRMAVRP
jgi:5'-deoxynucleotidase YfbR-like HD superfamily hydrolase